MGDFVGLPPVFPQGPDPLEIWRRAYSQPSASQDDGKVQSLAQTYQADPEYVRDNLIDFQSRFAAQQLYSQTFKREYPTLSRNLVTSQFVSRVRDDMGNIIETEGWWNGIANAYNVARDTVAIGNIGTRAMLDGRDLYPYERRKIERARQRQRAHMQSEPGFLAAAAELAGTMQETLGYSLAAGYTAGAVSGPAAPVVAPIAAGIAGFATSFNLEAGNLYADLIMDGYTPAQATEIGASYGALIAGFEAVGLKFAGKPIKELGKELFKKQGRDLLRRETAGQITGRIFADYAKGILAESTTEGVQEILSELGKARASQIYRPENLYEPEYYETFQQAFVHTAKGMVVLGGVPSAVRLANDSIKSANANYDFEKAREAAEIRSRSQAPEAQSQIDAEAAEADSYNSSYYIRAQDFLTGIRAQGEAQGFTEQQVRETVEANSPGLMSRIDEAAERDGDVELTKADWDKAFHDTKFRETTFQHTAFEEDGLTKREADENEAIREKAMQDASEEAKQALQDQETFEQELREVRRDLRNQLDVALEGMDAAQTMTAAANSAVLSGFIRRNALAMGIGPKEFVEKHLPQIVQQRLTGQQRGEGFQAGVEGQVFSPDPNKFYRGFQEVSELDRLRHMMKGEFYPDSFVIEMDEDTEAYDVGGDGVSDKPGAFRGYVRPEKVSRIFVDVDAYSTYPTETVGELREMFPNAEIVNVRLVERTGQPDLFVAAEPGPRPGTLESGTFDQDADYTFTEGDYRPEVVAWAKEQFGDRVAPNGKPVYQNFVRWFGDSKVVDEDGKPLVVYHGTGRGFESFSRDAISRPGFGHGFHFAISTDLANYYANQWDSAYMREQGLEASPRVIPAFLSIKNPASQQDYDAAKEQVGDVGGRFDREVKVREYLEQQGFDGIRYDDPLGARSGEKGVLVAFNPNQIKSTQNAGDFSADPGILYSKEGAKKVLGTASFEGTDAIQKILLDPDAKPTTLMHELMHWNLELMATIGLDIETKVAQAGYEATVQEAQILGDIQRLLKWSGFEGTLTEWRAMTTDQRRPFHEAVAVSFETYLYEGVAPSRELRGVFSRLADYIRGAFEELVLGYQRDYQQEFGRPLPSLNDDVRAIFGRMMSAERDVEMFLTENDLDAMMVTREEWVAAGRDASEYDEYEREFKDAIYEAKAELTQRRMKEVAYQQNARRRIGKDLDRELREATKQIRTEEELAARLTAVQQVREWIKTGKYLTEEGEYTPLLSGNRKLDRDAIAAIDPELAKSMPRSLLKRGGLPLEVARQQFGFESVEQMLQALAESRSLKEEVDARTDQRVLDELTDLTDPIVVEEKIQSAIHNKIRQRIVALELKYLLNNGRSSRLEMRLATDIARRIIETTPTGDINLRSYSAAASRARKKALKALKDGDMEAAAFAKRQELVNEALIREGGKAREEVRKLVRMNQRVFKRRTDKAIAEAGYDVVVVKALRALLNRLGIGTLDGDPAEMLARFQQEDPGFFGEVRRQIEYFLKMDLAQPRVGDRRKPMEHLTVGDVRSLRGLAKRMMKRAKDKRSATIGERKANIDTLRQEAQDTLESNVEVTREPDDKSIFGQIRDYLSDITRFEHLFRRADGGKVGIWTQMFRQVKDAANKYRQELRQFLSGDGFDFEGKLRSLDLKIPGGVRTLTMDLPAAGRKVEIGKNGRHAKTELIHLAMHYYGNSSNRKRLVEGYAGRDATEDTMQQVDVEIRRFLEQQIQQGILTRKDFEFMQSVFDHFSGADMLGRAQKVMKNLRGYEMTEVKGEKFLIQFPDGEQEFGGGYIPVRFKETVQKEDQGQGVLEEDASLEQQASRMVNILPGFTKDRVKGEVGLELHLGLSGLANHAAEVYRFINMAEPIDSVSRVLNGRDLAAAFKARFGNKAYTNLEGWLKRSAFQRFDRGEQSEVGSMLLRMSRNANMSVMFLNIGNTLQNYAGLLIPMRRVGKRRLISALIHSAFNKKLAAEVASKSKEMKARLERQIFDIYNSQTRILTSEDSAWARLQSWSDKYAYVLQQITQNHVDLAVWQAAYNQETEAALKEGMSAGDAEARAVAHADSIVRQSQMAGEKEDISAFEAGGSISRALFPFKSWFINWFNNAATQRRLDLKVEDRSRVAAVASTYLYMLMIPAVLAQAAVELARGEDWDDDDDGYGDDMLELFARSQFDQVVGGLPGFGDISRLLADNWFDDEYWNNRYPVAPWIRAWERIASAPVRKDAVDAGLDMATQAANLMGVPAVGVWNRVNLIGDEIAGELESESTYDLIRGAVTGQRSDLQRLSQ